MTTRRTARTAVKSAEEKDAARRALAEQLHASITDQVAALVDSDAWRAYLDHMAAFHSYSTGRGGVFGSGQSSDKGVRA